MPGKRPLQACELRGQCMLNTDSQYKVDITLLSSRRGTGHRASPELTLQRLPFHPRRDQLLVLLQQQDHLARHCPVALPDTVSPEQA